MRRSTQTRLAWLLAAAWGALIWGLGSDGFSVTSSSRFLAPLIDWLSPGWSLAQHQAVLVAIRKLAHVTEYGLFALLVGHAVALAFEIRMRFVIAGALAAVTGLAVADELRQALSLLRTGSPFDVALDVSGGILALAGLCLVRRRAGRPLFGLSADSQA